MNLLKTIKLKFFIIICLIVIISFINVISLYKMEEYNSTKNTISSMVDLQDEMNSLVLDAIIVNSAEELLHVENKFLHKEELFEKIKDFLIVKDKDDALDYFIKDLHKSDAIKKALNELFLNEKSLEKSFDNIVRLQKEKIAIKELFKQEYPKESNLRKTIEKTVWHSTDIDLIQAFANMKYYSKEALYQHKDERTLNKWLERAQYLYAKTKNNAYLEYEDIIKKLSTYILKLNAIEHSEKEQIELIQSILEKNGNLNNSIESSVKIIVSDFNDDNNNLIWMLSIITIAILLLLAYTVSKNVGLTVTEINNKVEKGLKEIKSLNNEIETTQKEVVFTMGAIGESRSKETGNHVKRVAEYTKLFALYYGLSKKEAEMLKQASPMHDIGKVGIPDAVLNKPGRFDEAEREIMNTHAQLGFDMLKGSNRPLLKMAATVAYEHHEKWDGTGYPQGKKADDIHIYGRITAIADVFDALGSDRVYKKAWNDEKIFALFKEERAKHFDPTLVDIFFEHLDEFLKIRDTFKDN